MNNIKKYDEFVNEWMMPDTLKHHRREGVLDKLKKSLIKKKLKKEYIDKKSLVHADIDPYGEEDWEDFTPVLQIAKNTGKPYDQITKLDCFNNQLTSLEGIENLINLERLYCSYNQLTSLSGIENLINLQTLFYHNNNFSYDYKEYLKNYCKNNNIKLKI